MVTGLIGKKVGMTQLFAADGSVSPATVLKVDAENNLLLVEGSVPGGPNAYVTIRKAVAAKPIRIAQAEPVKKRGKK